MGRPIPSGGLPNGVPLSQRALVIAGVLAAVAGVLLLVWFAHRALLLAFAGVLVAVLLSTPAALLHQRARLPYRVALFLVLVLLGGTIAVAVSLRGPAVVTEVDALRDSLPRALDALRDRVAQYPWGPRLLDGVPTMAEVVGDQQALAGRARDFAARLLALLSTGLIILFTGLFLAVEPGLYVRGVVRLVPPRHRERARVVMDEVGRALRWWLLAKVVSMFVIGVGTGVGLYLLGVPLVFSLGLIAALLTFVPNIGPIVSAVPAVLLALVQGPRLAFWVVLLYLGVQVVESYLITPYLERRTVSLPPALTLTVQVLLGAAAGVLGIALAAPLTAVGLVLVRMLYVEDVLGDRTLTGSEQNPG
ncbi:AI-2E family transporter [Roseisolibacter sp. H3M3-2]|uniref:AI-2E family transporter n=1 Tax=Roseisolibacter sp. H3M3-2 TaxID=3031323 RepID=UPI0023DCA541|nr:AI-2E family transporter [Roseisolibacter sp. H3M3-2]MDF1501331.1 AI-2E family transporter [Roseisolibacter sp. H3M3-2]